MFLKGPGHGPQLLVFQIPGLPGDSVDKEGPEHHTSALLKGKRLSGMLNTLR